MKFKGGFLPKISGRPSHTVENVPTPDKLYVNLIRKEGIYSPAVENGRTVKPGEPLAEIKFGEGKLFLPSPAAGKAFLNKKEEATVGIILERAETGESPEPLQVYTPERTTRDKMLETLTSHGLWPCFWSSSTGGIPSLKDVPKAVIVNNVITEPFHARGNVILSRSWDNMVTGLKFLQRMMADYSTTHVTLTDKRDPLAKKLYSDLSGFVWLRFHPVPLTYPVENPVVLYRALKKSNPSIKREDTVWVIDVQGLDSIGVLLGKGLPIRNRVVALGGPGYPDPKHVSVSIGTPLSAIIDKSINKDNVLILRGGLLKGEPVDPDETYVDYDDDAFFFLPKVMEREFLSFLRPGFKRTSIMPCFASRITGAPDRQITNSLRGEIRPCIACGLCEKVCPVDLLPHVLHRYLYRGAIDEANAAGVNLCVECGLCTFVCPSKIELEQQFLDAAEQLRLEHEEAEEAELETVNNDH
jgi:Na+-transporting NADH:ubiquinone oxidoreductase subunit A